ncbi:hypothetical protein LTR40_006259, partial [Exophiala xenobiotica]
MESTPTSGTQTPASTMSSTTDETSTSSVSEIEAPTTTSTSRNLDFSTLQDLFPLAPSSGEQQLQHDPSSLWYILTTAVLLSFHREKLTGALWEYLATTNADSPQNEKELLEIARRIRESCLKASTLVGFPR